MYIDNFEIDESFAQNLARNTDMEYRLMLGDLHQKELDSSPSAFHVNDVVSIHGYHNIKQGAVVSSRSKNCVMVKTSSSSKSFSFSDSSLKLLKE